MNNEIKSCLSCAHFVGWHFPETYWEPADTQWDCGLRNSIAHQLDIDEQEAMDKWAVDNEDVALGLEYASQCHQYHPARKTQTDPDLCSYWDLLQFNHQPKVKSLA